MSCYLSNVTIICEREAFEMLREAWEKAGNAPDCIESNGNDFILLFKERRWYEEHDDVKEIMEVIRKLETNFDKYDGYSFKYFEIGEDNATNERSNSAGDITYEDYGVSIELKLPENVEDITDNILWGGASRMKVKATWEFDVDITDFIKKYLNVPELAKELTKVELKDRLERGDITADEFDYIIEEDA